MKLIVSDLDNTLLNEDGDISPETFSALNAARKSGVLVAFATARPERATRRIQKAFEPDYVIANNGATLVKRGENIWNDCIPDEILHEFAQDVFAEAAIDAVSIEMGDRIYQDYEDLSWGGKDDWTPMIVDVRAVALQNVPKFSTRCGDPNVIIGITAKYPGLKCYFNTGASWQQIQRADTGKLSAVIRLADRLGICLSDVVAFGDDHNDEEMLRGVGMGVAVANASPGAKNAARDICPSNSENGVAQWLMAHL